MDIVGTVGCIMINHTLHLILYIGAPQDEGLGFYKENLEISVVQFEIINMLSKFQKIMFYSIHRKVKKNYFKIQTFRKRCCLPIDAAQTKYDIKLQFAKLCLPRHADNHLIHKINCLNMQKCMKYIYNNNIVCSLRKFI